MACVIEPLIGLVHVNLSAKMEDPVIPVNAILLHSILLLLILPEERVSVLGVYCNPYAGENDDLTYKELPLS